MTELEWLNEFGERLKKMLETSGISQKELAKGTGLSEGAISNYINGRRIPSVKALINMSYELDCTLDELMEFGDRIDI